MSINHMNLVMNRYDGPAHLKLTLLLIADHAGENGECFPSYETLAARLCCSERTAIRNVKQLVDEGYLEYAKRGGRVYDKVAEKWINASNTFRVIDSALEVLPNLKQLAKTKGKERKELSTEACGGPATDVTPRTDADVTPLTHNRGDAHVRGITNRNIINNHHQRKAVENVVRGLAGKLAMPQ